MTTTFQETYAVPVQRRNKPSLHECKLDIQEALDEYQHARNNVINAAVTLGRAFKRAARYCTDAGGLKTWLDFNFPALKYGQAQRFMQAADAYDSIKKYPQRKQVEARIGVSVAALVTAGKKIDKGEDPLAKAPPRPYVDRLAEVVKREKAVTAREKAVAMREKAVAKLEGK